MRQELKFQNEDNIEYVMTFELVPSCTFSVSLSQKSHKSLCYF